ncbi:MAG: SLC45 family MFS transporter [Anaerolineae bacterium]
MTARPFPWGKTFVVGFGFFGISVIWPLFNSLIPPMLEDLGLAAVVIGFILTWDNLLNVFVQPIVGSRSDHTRTRFGRRKPWIMVGAPLAALFFILVPFVRHNFILIALAILGTNIGMALFRSPTIAFLGDLFAPAERSKANGVINLMGGVAGAIALFTGGALYKLGVPLPFIFGAAILLAAVAIVLWRVQEPPLDADPLPAEVAPGVLTSLRQVIRNPDKSGLYLLGAIFAWFVGWNAMEAFFTLYARHILNVSVGQGTQMLTAFAAMLILFAIPSGLIATKVGRRPTIMVGLVGMLAGLIVGFMVRQPVVLLGILAVMGGFWALININSLPMVYDLARGDNIGAYTGLYYLSSSLAAITGPILAGGLVDLAGYRAIWLFTALFMLIALALMSRARVRPQ